VPRCCAVTTGGDSVVPPVARRSIVPYPHKQLLMLSLTRPAAVVFIAVVSLEDTANICILALPPL